MKLKNITLFIYETRSLELALFSINKSTEYIQFGKIILATTYEISHSTGLANQEIINVIQINPEISYSEYIIKGLPNIIETDYVLITQWDSWVTNPSKWSDEFLSYDYIGAPWPNKNKNNVGNGGFSLRSKRLLHAAKKIGGNDFHPEDIFICQLHRQELEEKHEIRFAPTSIASDFSFERQLPHKVTFGFHGLFNFLFVLSNKEIIDYIESKKFLLGGIDGYDLIENLRCRGDLEIARILLHYSVAKKNHKEERLHKRTNKKIILSLLARKFSRLFTRAI